MNEDKNDLKNINNTINLVVEDNEQITLDFGDNKKEIIKEIKNLRKQIEYYNKKYHEEDVSEISDYAYDDLNKRLRELELTYPEYVGKSNLTKKIGGKTKKDLVSVTHDVQMQSLQDVFSFI